MSAFGVDLLASKLEELIDPAEEKQRQEDERAAEDPRPVEERDMYDDWREDS